MSKSTNTAHRLHSIGDRVVTPDGVLDQIVGIWLKDSPAAHWDYLLRGRAKWWHQEQLTAPSKWQGEMRKTYPPDTNTTCPTCGKNNDEN